MLNPGNPQATEKGCKCPTETNQGGQGTYPSMGGPTTHFVVAENCPLHGKAVWKE